MCSALVKPMYSGYIFFCDNKIQEECLRTKKYTCSGKENVSTNEIKIGSVLFLYNPDSDTLLGPFTALSEGAETVDTGTWKMDIDNHSASQNVRLEWEELHTLANATSQLPFLRELKSCKLTSTQTQNALDALKPAPLYIQVRE
jgi:hypothetical protein